MNNLVILLLLKKSFVLKIVSGNYKKYFIAWKILFFLKKSIYFGESIRNFFFEHEKSFFSAKYKFFL